MIASSAHSEPSGGSTALPSAVKFEAHRVEHKDTAMGTSLNFVAYTAPAVNEQQTRSAIAQAIAEMRRLEQLLSEWQDSSEVSRVNLRAGQWVSVGLETETVLERSLFAGKISEGAFDITFHALGDLWKFGSAQDAKPQLPAAAEIQKRRARVDYRRIELDRTRHRVRLGKDQKIGLGGIAKGFIVDQAVRLLRQAGLSAFLVQAGGDLYGAGRKPDGSAWISGIQDPRGAQGSFFATIELEDHAFSTAGDYARSFLIDGKRFHHIIDPRTGYPATASRSVTVWANDATTADMVDDAVFILGQQKGLELADSIEGVGVVVVDSNNAVWTNHRMRGRLNVLRPPSNGL